MMTDEERRELARSCDRCEYRPVCSTRRTCGDSAWCCSTYKKRIDRDALLGLADEMDSCSRFFDGSEFADCLKQATDFGFEDYANIIRKALGEE